MSRPDYLLVAPDPMGSAPANPGGQLTATRALRHFAAARGLRLAFVDTLSGNFPPPRLPIRVLKAIKRQILFLGWALFKRPRRGVLIFAAGPASFLERAVTGLLGRMLSLPTAICLRSGHLAPLIGGTSKVARLTTFMLRTQQRIVLQGTNWLPLLAAAGIDAEKVAIVPNWLDPRMPIADRPHRARPGFPVRFIFVGWLVAEKGIRELLEAAASLKRDGHDFCLTLVGDGTLRERVERQIAVDGLAEEITLEGWLSPSEVRDRLGASDVLVLPSHFEGFPNVLLEAFSLGRPAIATAVGGIPDSLADGEAGFLVRAGDPDGLAAALRRYIEAPELVERHSVCALAVVRERHDFERNCQALLATLQS